MTPRAGRSESAPTARIGPGLVWCTDRTQGNVGDHVGDDPAVVARNRAALRSDLGIDDDRGWVWLRQVHGTGVHVAAGPRPSGPAPDPPVADAAVTAAPGIALAVVTADCAPLVVACDNAIGVAHAGHRGLEAGVIEATIAALREVGSGDVHAFLGPCIRPASYEFAAADLDRFVAQFGPSVAGRTRAGQPALDLGAAIAIVLEREGVVSFDDCGICTADSDAHFSYRRSRDRGRQATIALLP